MEGIEVFVGDQSCYNFPIVPNDPIGDYSYFDNLPEKIDIFCGTPLTGSTVKLRKRQGTLYRVLNICEVQVW
ncbi:hypothetical protein BaRGS_00013173, partial [Batillaria attramentaria]